MSFCTDAGKREEMLRRFSALNLDDPPDSGASSSIRPSAEDLGDSANTKSLSDVMMALRKLREGIVATKRGDGFAVQVYIFCIRLSILVKHPESYHPAILHLLHNMFPLQSLTSTEREEIVGYLVLDAACRRRDLAEAYALRHEWKLRDKAVTSVVSALTHDNFTAFQRLKQEVDSHKAKLMEWAEDDMRLHALKCFGRTYFSVELSFLEATMGSTWEDLRKKDSVGWELDQEEGRVTIRRAKVR